MGILQYDYKNNTQSTSYRRVWKYWCYQPAEWGEILSYSLHQFKKECSRVLRYSGRCLDREYAIQWWRLCIRQAKSFGLSFSKLHRESRIQHHCDIRFGRFSQDGGGRCKGCNTCKASKNQGTRPKVDSGHYVERRDVSEFLEPYDTCSRSEWNKLRIAIGGAILQ